MFIRELLSFQINSNAYILKKLQIRDLFLLSQNNEKWTIWTYPIQLHGIGRKRLKKYRFGLGARLNQLAHYYGIDVHVDLNPGDFVLDIGANIGEFSLFALNRKASVVAVEPDTLIFKCLEKNISHKRGTIGLINAAIAESSGEKEFFSAPHSADSSLIEPANFNDKYSTACVTLDELYFKYNLNHVDLIKCDAEGGEPEVFAEASKALSVTKAVTVSCGPERKGEFTVGAVCRILELNNFTVKVVDGYRPQTTVIGHNKDML